RTQENHRSISIITLLMIVFSIHSSVRPPPWSPLFPYTTLFRSHDPPGHDQALGRAARLRPDAVHRLVEVRDDARDALAPRLLLGDRKSTRLNSSHVKISYAVFCLK